MSEQDADIMFVFEDGKIHVFIKSQNTIERIYNRGEEFFDYYINDFEDCYTDCIRYVKKTGMFSDDKIAGVFAVIDNRIDKSKIDNINREFNFIPNNRLFHSIESVINEIFERNINLKRSKAIFEYCKNYYLLNSKSQTLDLFSENNIDEIKKGKPLLSLDPDAIAELILLKDKAKTRTSQRKETEKTDVCTINQNNDDNALQKVIKKFGEMIR